MRNPRRRWKRERDWQPFETVRLACERSAAQERERENPFAAGVDPTEAYAELAKNIEKRMKQTSSPAISAELSLLQDLNATLQSLIQEMKEDREKAKARLEKAD